MNTLQILRGNRVLASITASAILVGSMGIASIAFAAAGVVTMPATAITSTDATLNGVNDDAATGSSFWVSTSTFSASSSSSPVLPPGVHGTGDLGPVASSSAFSALASQATIPAGLQPIMPNTTYFYTAYVLVDGIWYPGEVLSFTTLAAAPTVTGITPTTGTTTGGTMVTIDGTDLTGATLVQFGTTPATGVTVSSSTSLTAIAPPGTGTVNVTVTTPGGTSATSSANEFTYVAPTVLAPVISDVAVSSTTATGATITWNTDTPASTQVHFGTTTAYGSSSAYDGTPVTSHSVTLTGLDEITTYQIQVASGNSVATTTATTVATTLSTASSTPLALADTEAIDTTGVSDGTFENGWHWVLTFTVPDNETEMQMRFTNFTSGANSIAAASNIRIFTAQSSNATSSASAVTSTNNDYGTVINLTGDSDAGTPGRQVDVHVQVRIPFGTPEGSYSTTFGVRTDTP